MESTLEKDKGITVGRITAAFLRKEDTEGA